MPRVVLTHAVVDIERWLEGKSERAPSEILAKMEEHGVVPPVTAYI